MCFHAHRFDCNYCLNVFQVSQLISLINRISHDFFLVIAPQAMASWVVLPLRNPKLSDSLLGILSESTQPSPQTTKFTMS